MYGFSSKIRKITAVFLAAASLSLFTACDGGEAAETEETEETRPLLTDTDGNPVPVTDEEGNVVTNEEGSTIYEEEPVEEPIVYKVGFIYGNKVENGATNAMFEIARKQIEKTLGLETCYIDNCLVADVPKAVNALQDNECNIIISCTPKFANSITKEANASADTYYLSFGGTNSSRNLSSFGGALYQTTAVCGIAAAHNTVSNVIGIIADPTEYNVFGVINGFTLGANEIWGAHTDIRLNWAWSNEEDKIEAAVDDLISQGCDVIMSYMENDYAAKYCEGKDIKVVSNAYNLPEIAPNNYITGYFFNFSTYIVDEVRAIVNDNFVSKVYEGDIANGCIRLVNFGLNCKEGTEAIGNKLYEYIKAGKDHVYAGEIKNTDGAVMVEKGQSLPFKTVLNINWLAQGIRKTQSFADVIENPVGSDLEIKK